MATLSTVVFLAALCGLAAAIDDAVLVSEHNQCRSDASSGLAAMSWDPALATFAQDYADNCPDGSLCSHSTASDQCDAALGKRVGENIYWAAGSSVIPGDAAAEEALLRSAVQKWCNETIWYNHAANNCSAPAGKSCGHYTAIVWEETTTVGCGIAYDTSDPAMTAVHIVCNYAQIPNVNGLQPYDRTPAAASPDIPCPTTTTTTTTTEGPAGALPAHCADPNPCPSLTVADGYCISEGPRAPTAAEDAMLSWADPVVPDRQIVKASNGANGCKFYMVAADDACGTPSPYGAPINFFSATGATYCD